MGDPIDKRKGEIATALDDAKIPSGPVTVAALMALAVVESLHRQVPASQIKLAFETLLNRYSHAIPAGAIH